MEPEPSHIAPSELIGYVLMISLSGKSNLRDSAEFGFLEVARGPRSQIIRADHSVAFTPRSRKAWKNAGKPRIKVNMEEKLVLALHRNLLILAGKHHS
jgi:hypothetical protein